MARTTEIELADARQDLRPKEAGNHDFSEPAGQQTVREGRWGE